MPALNPAQEFWNILKNIDDHKKEVRKYLEKMKNMKEQDARRFHEFVTNTTRHLKEVERAVRHFKEGVTNNKTEDLMTLVDTVKRTTQRALEDIKEDGERLVQNISPSAKEAVLKIVKEVGRWFQDMWNKIPNFNVPGVYSVSQVDKVIRDVMKKDLHAEDKPSLLTEFGRQLNVEPKAKKEGLLGKLEGALDEAEERFKRGVRNRFVEKGAGGTLEDVQKEVKNVHDEGPKRPRPKHK